MPTRSAPVCRRPAPNDLVLNDSNLAPEGSDKLTFAPALHPPPGPRDRPGSRPPGRTASSARPLHRRSARSRCWRPTNCWPHLAFIHYENAAFTQNPRGGSCWSHRGSGVPRRGFLSTMLLYGRDDRQPPALAPVPAWTNTSPRCKKGGNPGAADAPPRVGFFAGGSLEDVRIHGAAPPYGAGNQLTSFSSRRERPPGPDRLTHPLRPAAHHRERQAFDQPRSDRRR